MTTVSALQMVSVPDIHQNLATVDKWLSTHHVEGEHLVVLPECFAFFGGKDKENQSIKSNIGEGVIQEKLLELAKRYQCWIVAGTIPTTAVKDDEVLPDKFSATSLLINSHGRIVADYQKIHLFDVDVADNTRSYRESDSTLAGNKVVVVDTPFGKLGMAVCYDLRFSGLFQSMRESGAELFVLPSAFTNVTGKAHWLPLLQARAIETQCYMVAANQGGEHQNGRETYGHSCIIDPWGRIRQQAEYGEAIISDTIDLVELDAVRAKMPIQAHNRFNTEIKTL
ncbi:carbon-nitrogen hydrolase family protein [Flocculibacter collagenilyticus]|uniref:carbon-nitrogen hydrolase family protein n=1 Tax=Flocculibacter collagenilyticus TaxID=2744479 RepID=UPI0018F77CF2|nr:carbon-nitrogen hydrolase family protein [Flocculibacter collagenilyticus]